MTREQIESLVNDFLINKLDINPTLIRPDVNMKNDIGLTSLDLADSLSFIQKTFTFRPDKLEVRVLQTLTDLYDYIDQHVN